MVKIFVTGDNHFGKKYDRYPEVKTKLISSRFEALEDMIKKAEQEECELFVVTGDLFDNTSGIKKPDVEKIVSILGEFSGTVYVLPGNHDYYTGEEKVWKDFESAITETEKNIILVTKFTPYQTETADEKITIYPAFCDSKHSKENKLDWIKEADIEKSGEINIGLAHGALKGVTPDIKEEYFLMTETELNAIPMDAWLIGHTHIPYPNNLSEDRDTAGYKVFNPGTHEQTDLHNNTDGNGFIITIEKNGEKATVNARKYVSGKIHFYDLAVEVKPGSGMSLEDTIKKALDERNTNSIVRLKVTGTANPDDYRDKQIIYTDILNKYLTYEVDDSELSEEITVEKIRSEYAETSFAAQFMEKLTEDPMELQMAYELLKNCKETR